ncbi:MAG: hypothetical protein ACJAYU_000469 [Bradymonadia bacterium]
MFNVSNIAIAAGSNESLADRDLNGLPRLVGDSVDLGAFERQPER